MTEPSQRDALIESAMVLFHRQGYASTGAREIAAHAGVPQGSFTNHFRSKEALAIAALDSYFVRLQDMMRTALEDGSLTPAERLLAYFDLVSERLEAADWRRGCLIPDLAAGLPTAGDRLQTHLVQIMQAQSEAFEAVVSELPGVANASDLAAFIVAAWHGTLLRMKAEGSPEAIHRFRRTLRQVIGSWPLAGDAPVTRREPPVTGRLCSPAQQL